MRIDPSSATWEAVKAHAEQEIESAIRQLEVRGAEPEFLRGYIKAKRELLAMADEPQAPIQGSSALEAGY